LIDSRASGQKGICTMKDKSYTGSNPHEGGGSECKRAATRTKAVGASGSGRPHPSPKMQKRLSRSFTIRLSEQRLECLLEIAIFGARHFGGNPSCLISCRHSPPDGRVVVLRKSRRDKAGRGGTWMRQHDAELYPSLEMQRPRGRLSTGARSVLLTTLERAIAYTGSTRAEA
jgi:hypothetical protein